MGRLFISDPNATPENKNAATPTPELMTDLMDLTQPLSLPLSLFLSVLLNVAPLSSSTQTTGSAGRLFDVPSSPRKSRDWLLPSPVACCPGCAAHPGRWLPVS